VTRPTLVEFLTARLDEDEAATADASEVGVQYTVPSYGNGLHAISDEDWLGGLRIDTTRVLADVKAKRAIVERAVTPSGDIWVTDVDVLHDLASVYADHPDYDATWAP
jgi:hypothetical protein